MAQYKLGCKDMGGMDCEFTTTGDTTDEVKQNLYAHAQEVHKDVIASMPEDKMKEMDQLMDKILHEQN